MLEFNLNYLQKVRIWFKNNENFVLPIDNTETRTYPANSIHGFVNSTVIVEMLIPRGARCTYGLLGANYTKIMSNSTKMRVCSGDVTKPKILNGALIETIEPAYLFLYDEYRNSIFSVIESIANKNKLDLSGRLDFCYAAISEVSSSEVMFSILAKLIFTLFHYPEKDISVDLLNHLIMKFSSLY